MQNFNTNNRYSNSNALSQTYSGNFTDTSMPPMQRGGAEDLTVLTDGIQYGGVDFNAIAQQYGGDPEFENLLAQNAQNGGNLKADIIHFLKKRKHIFQQRSAFVKKNVQHIISRKNEINKKRRDALKRRFFGTRRIMENNIRGIRGRALGRDALASEQTMIPLKQNIARSQTQSLQIAGFKKTRGRRGRHAKRAKTARRGMYGGMYGGSTINYSIGGVLSKHDSAFANGNIGSMNSCKQSHYK